MSFAEAAGAATPDRAVIAAVFVVRGLIPLVFAAVAATLWDKSRHHRRESGSEDGTPAKSCPCHSSASSRSRLDSDVSESIDRVGDAPKESSNATQTGSAGFDCAKCRIVHLPGIRT
jgi:hypothetical protein